MSDSEKQGPEPWAWLAFAQLGALAAGAMILASRPGGELPIDLWVTGRFALAGVAFALFFVGGVWGATHRPFLRRKRLPAFFCCAGTMLAVSMPMPYPSSYEGRPTLVELALPFEGEWTVRWGGEVGRVAPYVHLHDRRWMVHFVVADEQGVTASAADPADYPVFGREVLSPCEAVVVAASDGAPDHGPGRPETLPEVELGNHVVLEVGPGEYLFLANLQEGSVAVEVGERVRPDQLLGRVGNSGVSVVTPEPHLAVHLQSSAAPKRGEAIPLEFRGYVADGEPVEAGLPRGGVEGGRHVGQRVRRGP